jgi:hypothetical protein
MNQDETEWQTKCSKSEGKINAWTFDWKTRRKYTTSGWNEQCHSSGSLFWGPCKTQYPVFVPLPVSYCSDWRSSSPFISPPPELPTCEWGPVGTARLIHCCMGLPMGRAGFEKTQSSRSRVRACRSAGGSIWLNYVSAFCFKFFFREYFAHRQCLSLSFVALYDQFNSFYSVYIKSGNTLNYLLHKNYKLYRHHIHVILKRNSESLFIRRSTHWFLRIPRECLSYSLRVLFTHTGTSTLLFWAQATCSHEFLVPVVNCLPGWWVPTIHGSKFSLHMYSTLVFVEF